MEMITTKDDLLTTKDDLITTKDDLITTKDDLEREVSFLKNLPFSFACGSHYDGLHITTQAISYNTLLYSSTNIAGPHGLDISTGVFTAGHPGSYTATWSLMALDNAGDYGVDIYLRKNGDKIVDSRHRSYNTGTGQVSDQGGRTLVLHLDRGDTLDLYCQDCSSTIFYTTFCVSLSQADVE